MKCIFTIITYTYICKLSVLLKKKPFILNERITGVYSFDNKSPEEDRNNLRNVNSEQCCDFSTLKQGSKPQVTRKSLSRNLD